MTGVGLLFHVNVHRTPDSGLEAQVPSLRSGVGGVALGCLPLLLALACGGQSTAGGDETLDEYPGDGDATEAPDRFRLDAAVTEGGASGDPDPPPDALPLGSEGLPVLVGHETPSQFATESVDETGRVGTYAMSVGPDSPRATLGSHLHHIDFGADFRTVTFSARASRPLSLIVTVSPPDGTYFQALEDERPWQGVAVSIGEDWADHSVAIQDMMPLGEGEPAPLGSSQGSAVTLVLEESEAATVWIADLTLVR